MRVETAQVPTDNWLHFLRGRDLAQLLPVTRTDLQGPVLEIGCGDGYLSTLLRERFGLVFPTDISPRHVLSELSVASAEALPFRDQYFGFIFSSNVLEHIPDIDQALKEAHRVLRDDGMMLHTMPTVTWKFLQFFLYYIHFIRFEIGRRLKRLNMPSDRASGGQQKIPLQLRTLGSKPKRTLIGKLSRLIPEIHGVGRSHFEEFNRFRMNAWLEIFERNNFQVVRVEPLYLHSPYHLFSFRGLWLREQLSKQGLTSVLAYWVRKK